MRKSVFMLIITAVLFCGPPAADSRERVVIWGSTTCQKRFIEPAAAAMEEATGIVIKMNGVGTGKGMVALIDGKVEVGAASESLEGAVNSARKFAAKDGRDLVIPDDLVFHEIVEDQIIPIVHKDNTVDELSWEKLRDIHTGKIVNWKEVGGPDLPIQVVTSHTGSATRAVFQKIVMNGQEYVADAVVVDSTIKEILAVSKYKGGIGAVSAGFLMRNKGDTQSVWTDTIVRPLGLVTRGAPTPAIQRMIDYFRSKDAKKLYR